MSLLTDVIKRISGINLDKKGTNSSLELRLSVQCAQSISKSKHPSFSSPGQKLPKAINILNKLQRSVQIAVESMYWFLAALLLLWFWPCSAPQNLKFLPNMIKKTIDRCHHKISWIRPLHFIIVFMMESSNAVKYPSVIFVKQRHVIWPRQLAL